MKNLIKKTFIHRNEKVPYLWTEIGVTFLSVFIVIAIFFAQYHQFIFVKISHKLSGLVVDSVVVEATNQERLALGLTELKNNDLLKKAAQAKAEDMAKKGYFAHVTPDGKSPWYWMDQVGYKYKSAGENLAVNFDYSRDVVNAWMNSPTHKANVVKAKYQEIGIGIAEGFYQGRPTVFVVQMFGTPQEGGILSSTVKISATSSIAISSSTKVLGAQITSISLYELIFSGKIRVIVLSTIIVLIILVLLLALLNPNGKMIARIAKLALIPLTILLIAYIVLILRAGEAVASFMEV